MSEAPLEVLVIGNTDSTKHLSLPQQLVGITFDRLKGSLQMPVHVTHTNKDHAGDFLPSKSKSFAAVIIDPAQRGEADHEWQKEAREKGLLNGQITYFLSSGATSQREMCYAARTVSMEKLAYRIAGKK